MFDLGDSIVEKLLSEFTQKAETAKMESITEGTKLDGFYLELLEASNGCIINMIRTINSQLKYTLYKDKKYLNKIDKQKKELNGTLTYRKVLLMKSKKENMLRAFQGINRDLKKYFSKWDKTCTG